MEISLVDRSEKLEYSTDNIEMSGHPQVNNVFEYITATMFWSNQTLQSCILQQFAVFYVKMQQHILQFYC